MLLGIDISNNNPGVHMPTAAAQGVGFCIAKCSQGWLGGPGGWQDWTFVDIVTRARAAGIQPGGYHWALKGNGALQAQNFVSSLSRVGGPRGLLCAIDIERNDWNLSLNVDPATIDDFLAEWDRLTGAQPILLYGASWYHDGYMAAGSRWASRPVWPAQYIVGGPAPLAALAAGVTPGFMWPFGGWTVPTIRQFTSSAVVAGVEVDGNVCQLNVAQLQALTQPGGQPSGEFTVDAQAQAEFDALKQQINGLVTIIQGGLDPKKNPFGLVGTRDIYSRLAAIEQKLGIKP